jgi:uncharacterized protein (TIGR01244 family)
MLLRVLFLSAALLAPVSLPAAMAAEAPFGDKVSADITYYNRAAPGIGTAGLLQGNAVAEAKAHGFKVIVDLRGPAEGLEPEKAAAAKAGITYINIPVTTAAPTDAQIADFARVVENAADHPVLVHCHTANRVGAMWALYRASRGVPGEIAIEEGRAVGLKSREAAVRAKLGLPAGK